MRIYCYKLNLFLIKALYSLSLAVCLVGCGDDAELKPVIEKRGDQLKTSDDTLSNRPRHIKVQHILIGFKGSIEGKPLLDRTRDEAENLAYKILEGAKKGKDFTSLVEIYTDDSPPGFYRLANFNVPTGNSLYGNRGGEESPRSTMVKAFGDVSFSLKVGEIGIANYDEKDSPYGWHIIKRIE